ncbi:MAG: hypothetical protein HQK83_13605 [Fibrobacteria bacterium]|nr:hypothetical protein [Fibrobacteria bacterium]
MDNQHIKTFSFSFSELPVSREAITTAMGYPKDAVPEYIDETISEVFSSFQEYNDLEGGYRVLDEIEAINNKTELVIAGKNFVTGKIIAHRIQKADKVAVFVCTAGKTISSRSKDLFKADDPYTGYIIDAIASETVEKAMDNVQEQLSLEMETAGLNITNRYSPGYCGWPVSDQHKLFSLVPKGFCGVSLTDSALMIPEKSVSGIIGIGEKVKRKDYDCNHCEMDVCLYRSTKKSK